jgi:hypothetical protein
MQNLLQQEQRPFKPPGKHNNYVNKPTKRNSHCKYEENQSNPPKSHQCMKAIGEKPVKCEECGAAISDKFRNLSIQTPAKLPAKLEK